MRKYILPSITLILIIIGVISYYKGTHYIEIKENVIHKLEKQIDSLSRRNANLNLSIDSLNINVRFLDDQINAKNKEIQTITDEIDKILHDVPHYTPNELNSFFSNRYQNYIIRR